MMLPWTTERPTRAAPTAARPSTCAGSSSATPGAPSHLRGAGWKKTTLKAGNRIKVTIAPLRNGSRGGELVSATTVDGRSLVS